MFSFLCRSICPDVSGRVRYPGHRAKWSPFSVRRGGQTSGKPAMLDQLGDHRITLGALHAVIVVRTSAIQNLPTMPGCRSAGRIAPSAAIRACTGRFAAGHSRVRQAFVEPPRYPKIGCPAATTCESAWRSWFSASSGVSEPNTSIGRQNDRILWIGNGDLPVRLDTPSGLDRRLVGIVVIVDFDLDGLSSCIDMKKEKKLIERRGELGFIGRREIVRGHRRPDGRPNGDLVRNTGRFPALPVRWLLGGPNDRRRWDEHTQHKRQQRQANEEARKRGWKGTYENPEDD